MNYEMEIKFRCPQPDVFRSRIMKMGAVRLGDTNECDTYFAHPSRDFAATGEAFRVREFSDSSCITYKGPRLSSEVKIREEIETGIDAAGDFKKILDRLGFTFAGCVRKLRENYKLGEFSICIDDVDSLGVFAEIELVGTEMSRCEKEILELAAKLEVSEIEKKSYLCMLLQKHQD